MTDLFFQLFSVQVLQRASVRRRETCVHEKLRVEDVVVVPTVVVVAKTKKGTVLLMSMYVVPTVCTYKLSNLASDTNGSDVC